MASYERDKDSDNPTSIVASYNMVDPDKQYGVRTNLYKFVTYNDLVKPLDDTDPSTGGVVISVAQLPDPITGKTILLPAGNTTTVALGWAASGEKDNGLIRNAASDYGWYQSGTQIWRVTDSGFYFPQLTQGSVLFLGANGLVSQDNSNLYWEDTLNELRIGDNSAHTTFLSALTQRSSLSPGAGVDAYGFYNRATFVEAGSGTHALFAGAYFDFPLITAGAAAVTDAATVYIANEPAASGATNLALFVGAGNSRIRDKCGFGSVTLPDTVVHILGSNTTAQLTLERGGSSADKLALGVDSDGFVIQDPDNSYAKRFYVTAAGLCGIKAAPTYDLDVAGSVRITTDLGVGAAPDASYRLYVSDTATNSRCKIENSATGNTANDTGFEFYLKDNGGNQDLWSYLLIGSTTITAGAEVGRVQIGNRVAGTLATVLDIQGGSVTATQGLFTVNGSTTIASAAGATWNAVLVDADVTINGSTNITTATGFNMVSLNAPTITDAGTVTSVSLASTLYIGGAPIGSGVSLTDAYALWVDSGVSRFDGQIGGSGSTSGSTPSLCPNSNDLDTGIYSTGSNVLDITTGGGNRVSISSSGITLVPTTTCQGVIRVSGGNATTPAFCPSDTDTNSGLYRVTEDSIGISCGGALRFAVSGVNPAATAGDANYYFPQATNTSGADTGWLLVGAAHTGQTAGTEVLDVDFDLDATLQHATGAIATQRSFIIRPRTYSFAGASTITDAVIFEVTGNPIAGTNATITNGYAARFVHNDTTTHPQVVCLQNSTGDAALRWALGTTASFISGIDNSDSDSWKLSYAASGTAALGTNDYLVVTTAGAVRINGDVGIGMAPNASYRLSVSDSATNSRTRLENTASGNTANDMGFEFYLNDSGGSLDLFGYMLVGSSGVTAGSEQTTIQFGTFSAGSLSTRFSITGATIAFGTHTAIGAETVTGYITINDIGGTPRKLAVVS